MTLSESVNQILGAREAFGELFYGEFFRRCPEVEPHFVNVDMKRQKLMVTMTLTTIQQHHEGEYPAVESYLKHLGVLHARAGVPMETYPHWRAAMLHTLAKMIGPDWNRTLSAEWGLALDGALRVMLHGIEERGKE